MARPSAKHPTLRDVAALAGVSHQTVSRVINRRPHVLPETRARVEVAIQQLSYRPYAPARLMAQGRTGTLACLAPNLTDYTYASIMEGAESVTRGHGYYLLCAAFADGQQFDALIDQLVGDRRVDGVMIICPYLDDRHTHFPGYIPVALMGGCLRPDVKHLVYLDNRRAARQATEHLLALGHRRLGQVTGPMTEDCAQERDRGFQDALLAAGLAPSPALTVEGDWTATAGYRALQQLWARVPGLTAVVSQNDRMAVGMVRAARDMGLQVPSDLSVIGFDDMPLASYFDPPLTTMRQDSLVIGQTFAGLLLESLNQPAASSRHIRLEASLVVRQSTAANAALRKEVMPRAVQPAYS